MLKRLYTFICLPLLLLLLLTTPLHGQQGGVGGGISSPYASRFRPILFASLGTPSSGTVFYCSDCTAGSFPCTGGGTGADAFRVAGAWICPTTTSSVPSTRTISTTSPLGGGGDLSADRTLTCTTCATSANNLSFFSSTTSAQLLTLISNETGSGLVMGNDTPTILTPTIASFTNATHNHQNAAGGGTLDTAAFGSGTLGIARGGTGNTSGTATINANLTGPITSVGNTTSIAAQSGTGTTFLMNTGPSITNDLTFSTGGAKIVQNASIMFRDAASSTRANLRLSPNGSVANFPIIMEFYGTDFSADATNWERMSIRAKGSGDTNYVIFTDAGGTGTIRPIQITTGSNSGLTLNTDGSASYGGALSVTGHTTIEAVTSTGATGTGKFVYDTSPTFTTSAISPLFRSTAAKVLVQGTGTGATQLSATQTTAPTCSSNCGTSPSVAGTDTAGIVTMGGSGSPASGWVVTFNGTWVSAPACQVQMALTGMLVTKMPIVIVTTTTTITVTTNGTAPANSDKYSYICVGTQ